MSKPLPSSVTRRLAEKREDGSVIGVCLYCSEECYANKDGILRTRLMSGSSRCINGPHRIAWFYVSGPFGWKQKWVDTGKVSHPPQWYSEWVKSLGH